MAAYGCRATLGSFLKQIKSCNDLWSEPTCWRQGETLGNRYFSKGSQILKKEEGVSPTRDPPPMKLMNFPYVAFPNFLYAIKNWILVKLIVRPYLDHEFTTQDFMKGAEQAVSCVSSQLAVGNFDPLRGLVTSEALTELKKNYSQLDVKQRHNITVRKDDVYFGFPYQIGILFEDTPMVQKRYVEITTCFHYFLRLKDFQSSEYSIRDIYDHKERIFVCNYRFIKEFTKGVTSDWTINVINHFNIAHLEQDRK